MGPRKVDIAAVKLPEPFVGALRRLVAGTVVPSKDPEDADKVLSSLFGADAVTFGRVHRIDAPGLKDALAAAGIDAPVARIRELAELLRLVSPDAPVCESCGEFPFSNVGGKISALAAGALCPYCARGTVSLVPMTLRRLAWTDGRLVEPDTVFDLRSVASERIPLLDDGIVAWAGPIHSGLARALKEHGVSVYGFLAYARHAKQVLTDIADATALLRHPGDYGLDDKAKRDMTLSAAAAYLAEHEVTNAPYAPRYIVSRGLRNAPCVEIGGKRYAIEGRIGIGKTADVFRACADELYPEIVVVKIARDPSSKDAMRKEAATLSRLSQSRSNGAEHFSRVIPMLIAQGAHKGEDGVEYPMNVFRRKYGYEWTVEDIIREYPDGIDGKTSVWMWKRMLDLMAWTHMNGYVHRAIDPSHVLVHAVNHDVTFLGWSHAERLGAAVDATVANDIAMSARTIIAALGGDPDKGTLPSSLPGELAEIIVAHGGYEEGAAMPIPDAYRLHDAVSTIAGKVYGPRRYHPFAMPRP